MYAFHRCFVLLILRTGYKMSTLALGSLDSEGQILQPSARVLPSVVFALRLRTALKEAQASIDRVKKEANFLGMVVFSGKVTRLTLFSLSCLSCILTSFSAVSGTCVFR